MVGNSASSQPQIAPVLITQTFFTIFNLNLTNIFFNYSYAEFRPISHAKKEAFGGGGVNCFDIAVAEMLFQFIFFAIFLAQHAPGEVRF